MTCDRLVSDQRCLVGKAQGPTVYRTLRTRRTATQGLAQLAPLWRTPLTCRAGGHVLRESRARDRTKIVDSSQPSNVAALSHHCTNIRPRTWESGCQVDRWSSETSGITVSMAYRTGLKQRALPPPQACPLTWENSPGSSVNRPLCEFVRWTELEPPMHRRPGRRLSEASWRRQFVRRAGARTRQA